MDEAGIAARYHAAGRAAKYVDCDVSGVSLRIDGTRVRRDDVDPAGVGVRPHELLAADEPGLDVAGVALHVHRPCIDLARVDVA